MQNHIPEFAPQTVLMLNEDDDGDSSWNHTLRPIDSAQAQSRMVAHSRETSLEKLSQPAPPALASPRAHTNPQRAGLGGPDLSKTATYGHHRQTSIVHGVQHSRNGSLASAVSSPLSPQLIVNAGSQDMQSVVSRIDTDASFPSRPTTALNTSHPSPGPFSPDRAMVAGDASGFGATQRKTDRMQSRTRHGHAHKNSHSSRLNQKTVGEYALHVLFTSVSPARASAVNPEFDRLTGTVHCASGRKAHRMYNRPFRPRA